MITRALGFFLLLTLVSIPATAQTFGLGIRAGYNLAFAHRGGDTNGSPTSGVILGASAILEPFPSFALQAGVQYVQKNNSFEIVLPGGSTTVEHYEFDYLELPVSMTLYLSSGSPRVYVLLGSTLGTVLTATGGRGSEEAADSADVSESIDPIDLSVDIGAGMALDFGENVKLIAEAKYNYGLLDLYSYSAQLSSVNSWRARDLKLVAGLYFTL
jgi:hypothetical protein